MRLLGLGALIGLVVAAVVSSSTPAPRMLTDADVNAAIKQALASATPKPNPAITAFDNVKESTVLVKTRFESEPDFRPRGSGVIFDRGQTIITSLHILQSAAQINVLFFDGIEAPARVMEQFEEFDIALLETDMGSRKPAVMASARNLKVGDEAYVVGSPLGLANSLTVGVISRLGSTFQPSSAGTVGPEANAGHEHVAGVAAREGAMSEQRTYGGLIQFSAALYPGHSGGALVNRQGEVVGIVTWMASSSGVSGLGFAVPMDAASSAPGAPPF